MIVYPLPRHLIISFFFASIMEDRKARQIIVPAIGEAREYNELLKRIYFDCIAELRTIKAIVFKLTNNKISFPDVLKFDIIDRKGKTNNDINGINRRKNVAIVIKEALILS